MILFDHINIRTSKLSETVDFYQIILGAKPGFRPPFPFPGAWLYIDGKPVIHIVEESEESSSAISSYFSEKKTQHAIGNLHHVAFKGEDIDEFIRKVNSHSLKGGVATPPGTGQSQVFLQDPNGITIEMLFDLKNKKEAKL